MQLFPSECIFLTKKVWTEIVWRNRAMRQVPNDQGQEGGFNKSEGK